MDVSVIMMATLLFITIHMAYGPPTTTTAVSAATTTNAATTNKTSAKQTKIVINEINFVTPGLPTEFIELSMQTFANLHMTIQPVMGLAFLAIS